MAFVADDGLRHEAARRRRELRTSIIRAFIGDIKAELKCPRPDAALTRAAPISKYIHLQSRSFRLNSAIASAMGEK